MQRDLDARWDEARWVRILDRIEHRQDDVGLRFWGPPLWLEVTMTGPDSDHWPAIDEHATAWDWQSNTPCTEAVAGADDDCLMALVARYTIENLVLNAVHEIGEWLRFDGRRLFPAHPSGAAAPSGCDDQGNGAVTLQVQFGQVAPVPGPAQAGPAPYRIAEVAAASRFTYLPGTTVSYEAAGPVVRRWSDGEATTLWRSTWSSATLAEVAADGPELVSLIGRDVHRALVSHETDRICRAFHVDGDRCWSLSAPAAFGAHPSDPEADRLQSLSILVDYTDVPIAGY